MKEDKKKSKFVWLDTDNYRIMEINNSVTNSNGEPAAPIDCIKVKEGTIIRIYQDKKRGSQHLCVGGRTEKSDAKYGLHCEEDFDTDNYILIRTFPAMLKYETVKI